MTLAHAPWPSSGASDLASIDPIDERAWGVWRARSLAPGRRRLLEERGRLRQLGRIDEQGHATSQDLPADMLPGSNTGVVT